MSAVDELFLKLKGSGQKAFMPFITAGDPDLDWTSRLLAALVRQGSHLCELGIPYSDPIADGPVIQASYTRALAGGVNLSDIFSMLERTTPELSAPLVTMVSHAIVYRQGLKQYVDRAKQSGVAGLIVPDLPVEESDELQEICRGEDLSLIQLVTPNTPRDRALQIAACSSGFIYYVSVVGITGERQQLPDELLDNVRWLRKHTELPICIGFGISSPEHIRMLSPVADGLIVGSAIVRRIAACGVQSHQTVLQELEDYVKSLVEAVSEA
jgi:tryptophan synthase alpha chain